MTEVSCIILGNCGAGKSSVSPGSVTRKCEYFPVEVNYGGMRYNLTVVDTPGLIEPNQQLMERNKVEIAYAFQYCPKSIVLFVFNCASGGRLRSEDLEAFKALAKSFRFEMSSLCLVFNQVPAGGVALSYRWKLIENVKTALEIPKFVDTCFVEWESAPKWESLGKFLLLKLFAGTCTFEENRQHREIFLVHDEINLARGWLVAKNNEIALGREQHRMDVKRAKRERNEECAKKIAEQVAKGIVIVCVKAVFLAFLGSIGN